VRTRLVEPRAEILLSLVSAWELSIKYAVGKLRLSSPPVEFIPRNVSRQGVVMQPIELDHVLRVATLPMHHRDPFDRLLVAQAQALGATIVTADPAIARYDVDVLDPR
jgi:PIN domain nuclease of toxin-antitoxin system